MVERTLEADELSAVIEQIKCGVPLDFIPKVLVASLKGTIAREFLIASRRN